jgi:hypothetical protein
MSTNSNQKNLILSSTKNPKLPTAPLEYNKLFLDQLQQILGLYFNTVDNFTSAVSNPPNGTTANRPVASGAVNVPIGFMYFDTTLNYPVWWNGTVWKNGSGTTV